MINKAFDPDNALRFLEVLQGNIALVRNKIENAQRDFHLVVGDFDEKLQQAHSEQWPLDGEPSEYISFQYYKAMRLSNSANAKYIRKRYEEADRDITGLGLLDLLSILEATEKEANLIEVLLDRYESVDHQILEGFQIWIHTASAQVKRVDQEIKTEHTTPKNASNIPGSEARKSQAAAKIELNKSNIQIQNAKKHLLTNFVETSYTFYRLLGLANSISGSESADALIADQRRRINIYQEKINRVFEHVSQRDKSRAKIWSLSEDGRPIPRSGPGIFVGDVKISKDEVEHWAAVEDMHKESYRLLGLGRHTQFDDLTEGHPHIQYLLRHGDELSGDVEHIEGLIDGLRLSEHRHTGEDGSKQIHGDDILPGTLKDEKVDYDSNPPRPEDLSIEKMQLGAVPPGFVAVETTMGWDSYDRYIHELEVRLVSTPEGAEPSDDYADLIWVTGHRVDSDNQPKGPVLFAVDPITEYVTDFTSALPTFEHLIDLGGDPSTVETKQGAIADYSIDAVMILNMNNLLYRRFFPFDTTGDQLKYWEELDFPVLYDDLAADRSLASDGTILGYIAKGELGELIVSFSEDLGDSWFRETDPTLADGRAITCIDWSNGRWYRWCDTSPSTSPATFEWWVAPEATLPTLPGWSQDFESGFGQFTAGDSYVTLDTEVAHTGSQSVKLDGNGEDDSTRTLSVTCDVGGGGSTITFWGRVKSEYNYDFLRFYVNGVEKGSWSGDWDWSEFSFALPEGEVILEWKYTKDYSVSELEDAAWVDNISLPNSALPGQEVPPTDDPSQFEGMSWTTVTLPDNSEEMVNIVVTYAGGGTWVLTAGETSEHDDYYYISNDDGATWKDFNEFTADLDAITVRGETNTAYRGGAMALDSTDNAYGYYQNIGRPMKGDPLPELPIHPDLDWEIEHAGLFKAKKTWYLSPNGAIAGANFRAEGWHVIEVDKEIILVGSDVVNTFVGSRIFTQPEDDPDIGKPGIYFFIDTVSNGEYWGEDRLVIVDPDDPTQHTLGHSLPLPPWEGPWPYGGYHHGPIDQSYGYAPSAATVAISDGVPTLFVYTDKAEVWKSKTLHPTEASDWVFLGAVTDPLIAAAEFQYTYADYNSMASYGENIKILVKYVAGSQRGYDEFRPNFMIESFDGGETWRSVRLPYAYGAIQANNNFWWRYSGAVYTGTYQDPDQEWGISRDGKTWQDFTEFRRPPSTPQPADIDSMAWRSDGMVGMAQDGSTIWVTDNGGENWVHLFTGGYSCWVDKDDNLIFLGTSGQIWVYDEKEGRARQVASNVIVPDDVNILDGWMSGVGLIGTDATVSSLESRVTSYSFPYLVNPADDESAYTEIELPADPLSILAMASYRDVIRASDQDIQNDWYIRPNLRDEWGGYGNSVDGNPYLDAALLFSVDTTDRRISVGDLIVVQASSWGYSGFSYYTRWVDLPPGWNYVYKRESDPDTNFYTTMIQLVAYKFADETDVSGKQYDFYIETLNDNFANQGNAQDHGWHVSVSRVSEGKKVVSMGDPTSYIRYSTDGPRDWELDTPKDGHRILTMCHRTDRMTTSISQVSSPMIFTDYESGNMVYKGNHRHSIGFFGGSTMPNQKTRVRTETTGNEGSYQIMVFVPVYLEGEISGFTNGNASVFATLIPDRPISGNTTGTATGTATATIV